MPLIVLPATALYEPADYYVPPRHPAGAACSHAHVLPLHCDRLLLPLVVLHRQPDLLRRPP